MARDKKSIMKPAPQSNAVLRALTDDEETAVQATFIALCRQSPRFRHWLWEDFARKAKVRTAVAKAVDAEELSAANGSRWFAALSGEDRAWSEEQRRLQEAMPDASRLYGGLTWAEIESLVRHYESGALDPGAFLLAHEWHRRGDQARSSQTLARAAAALLDEVVRGNGSRLLRHLAKALRFLENDGEKSKRRAAVGYSDWWKLHALLFILRYPSPSYRTRELRAHLGTLGLDISAKDIRRFCARHGIRRDMRAGRPRKHN